jgi:hypothetical protein
MLPMTTFGQLGSVAYEPVHGSLRRGEFRTSSDTGLCTLDPRLGWHFLCCFVRRSEHRSDKGTLCAYGDP